MPSIFAAVDPNDSPGTKDPDLFSRMPGFHIYRSEFTVGSGETKKVEGYSTTVVYYANEGITLPSGLQIIQNYINAAKAVGGKEVCSFEDGGTGYCTLQIINDSKEVWVEVSAANNEMYDVRLVENWLLKQI